MTNVACKLAVEGRSLFEHAHRDFGAMQLIVVGDFRTGDQQGLGLVQNLFAEYSVRLFTPETLYALTDEIAAQGKPAGAVVRTATSEWQLPRPVLFAQGHYPNPLAI